MLLSLNQIKNLKAMLSKSERFSRSVCFVALSLLLSTEFAQAEFEVQKEYCTISNKFIGKTSDNIEYDGVVNISFTNERFPMPVININLSRNVKPQNMSITWPAVKLVDSQNRPLFERQLQARLETERTNTFNFKKESYSFYSQPYGFYRFQHFITFFLSQNNFTVNFVNEETGGQESQVVPLAGSDMAYREMAYLCFKDKVSDYINDNLTRKKVVHESWAAGYGLLSFFKLEDVLPEEVKFPNEITSILGLDSTDGYELLGDLAQLLDTKSELISEISNLNQKEDYVSLKRSIEGSAERVLSLNRQIDELGGDNGSIKRLELEITGFDNSIKTTSDSINVYEQQLQPLEEQSSILKIKIEELKAQLDNFEKSILLAQEQSASAESNIRFLNELILAYVSEYTSSELMNVDETLLSTPFSIDAIKESDLKVKEQLQKRIELNQIVSLIEAISGYMKSLVEDHEVALKVFNEMSELKLKRVNLQEKYTKEQLNEIEVHRAVGGISFSAISERIKSARKDSTLKGVTNADVKKRYLEAIRTSYNDYDKYLEGIQFDDQNVLAKMLCKSESFLRSFRGQCFNPIDAKDSKKIEIYIDQLDSTDISFLGFLVTGENSMIQRYDSGLVQLISDRVLDEMNTESTNKAIELWEEILFVRWAYYATRNLDDVGDFNFNSLEETLNVQKSELNKIIKEQERLTTDIVDVDFKIIALNKKFLEAEAKYFESLDKNQGYILAELVARSSIHPADVNLTCLVEITNVNFCAEALSIVESQTRKTLSAISEEIKGSVLMLVVTSQKYLSELQTSLNETLAEMNDAVNDKDTFMKSSDYSLKSKEYENMNSEVDRQRQRLKSLHEQKAIAEQVRLSLISEKQDITAAHAMLTEEMKALVADMQPTLILLKPICNEQNNSIASLNKVEGQILSLLKIKRNPSPVNSLCQIQF